MPLEPSPRMRIVRPAGSDAFKRQTYIDMVDKIDNFPGVVVSTSASPPTGLDWGAAQTGMLTLQSDTGRLMRFTGSSWVPVENYGRTYQGGLVPSGASNEHFGTGSGLSVTKTYNLTPSLVTTRVCTIRFVAQIITWRTEDQPSSSSATKSASFKPMLDGEDVGSDINETYHADAGNVEQIRKRVLIMGQKSNVPAGSHTIAVQASTAGSATTAKIRCSQILAMAWLSES